MQYQSVWAIFNKDVENKTLRVLDSECDKQAARCEEIAERIASRLQDDHTWP